MSNENHDKNINWRTKLQDLEHLPGAAFDKNASWNKLHARLQNRKRRLPIWYWAAAACLFFAMVIVWMVKNDTNSQPQKNEIANKQSEKVNKTISIEKNIASNEIKSIIIKEKTEQPNKIIKKENRVITPTAVSKINFTNTVIEVLNNKSLVDPLPVSSSSLATLLEPEKKKLNVVHVNELGDPANDFPVADHIDKRAFKFEIAKGEVVSSAVSQNTDFTISKIKSTSN